MVCRSQLARLSGGYAINAKVERVGRHALAIQCNPSMAPRRRRRRIFGTRNTQAGSCGCLGQRSSDCLARQRHSRIIIYSLLPSPVTRFLMLDGASDSVRFINITYILGDQHGFWAALRFAYGNTASPRSRQATTFCFCSPSFSMPKCMTSPALRKSGAGL